MAKDTVSIKKIYKYFKEAEHFRNAGLNAPEKRPEMAKEIIDATSRQNGLVAAAFFIPGSDMPVLTLNQMKMVIELAALFGQKLTAQRAGELLATFGSGYLFRGFTRGLLGVIPGPALLVKAGMAYSGTQALGKIAQKYFEAIAIENKSGN